MWRRQRCLGGCVQLPGDVWRDNIRNTKIRVTVKVAEVSKKVQKKDFKRFGHVERSTRGRKVRNIKISGKRTRGWPKKSCIDNTEKRNIRENNLTLDQGKKKRNMKDIDKECLPPIEWKRHRKRRKKGKSYIYIMTEKSYLYYDIKIKKKKKLE